MEGGRKKKLRMKRGFVAVLLLSMLLGSLGIQMTADDVVAVEYVEVQVTDAETLITTLADSKSQRARLGNNIELTLDEPIEITGDMILDLNGYELIINGGDTAKAVFAIADEAQLEVADSSTGDSVTVETTYATGVTLTDLFDEDDNIVDWDRVVTTADVSVTSPKGSITGSAKTLFDVDGKLILSNGVLENNTATVVNVKDGGTFEMDGGIIQGTTNAAAVNAVNATVNLYGGAISNNENRAVVGNGGTITVSGNALLSENVTGQNGGAIYADGGCQVEVAGNAILTKNEAANGGAICTNGADAKVTISGGYISSNTTPRFGGGIYVDDHSSAVISGRAVIIDNQAGEGGGICGCNPDITMTGGTIEGNHATGSGGGVNINATIDDNWIDANDPGSFVLSGGTIKNNTADFFAGGVFVNSKASFVMQAEAGGTGGSIEGNACKNREGGGITLYGDQGGAVGTITSGTISNNKTLAGSWGGGGIFCAQYAELTMKDVIITNNASGGFGGGVAVCPTGVTYLFEEEGGTIYGNNAKGEHLSNAQTTKPQDHEHAENAVFTENGYADLYSANASVVYDAMLGGGSAKWKGSADGETVASSRENPILIGNQLMGLTAYPSEADIDAAENLAKVTISGNYAFTHGGGILCNGVMKIGNSEGNSVDVTLNVSAEKALVNQDNDTTVVTKLPEFTFQLKDENGNVVAEGINDENGNISFDEFSIGEEDAVEAKCQCGLDACMNDGPWKLTYMLVEADATNQDIIADDTEYKVEVTLSKTVIAKTMEDMNDHDGTQIGVDVPAEVTLNMYQIDSAAVSINGIPYANTEFSNTDATTNTGAELKIGTDDNPAFTNQIKPIEINGTVIWDDVNNQDGKRPESVTVNLLADGELSKTTTVTVDDNGEWTYSFKNLPAYNVDGEKIVYTVTEDTVADYSTTIDGYDITNSHVPVKTSVAVEIVWDDGDDKDGIRPTSITVKLLADGKDTGKELTITDANNWNDDFTELDQYANGEKIEYTITVEGYETVITGDATQGYVVKYTPSGETTEAPSSDTTTEAPSSDTTTEAPSSDTTTEAPSSDTTTEAPSSDTTTEAPSSDTTTAVPSNDETTAAPSSDATNVTSPSDNTPTTSSADNKSESTLVDDSKDEIENVSSDVSNKKNPQTGDNSPIGFLGIMFIASILLMMVCGYVGKKRG